jgi:tight adherence protein B
VAAAGASAGEASILKQRRRDEAGWAQRFLLRLPRVRELDGLLQQSGADWSVSHFAALSAALGVAAAFVASFVPLLHWAFAAAAGLAAAAAPLLLVLRKRTQRLLKIVEQLPEALDLIGRALRAGHAFPSGLQMVGEEAPEPIAGEFRVVHDEINFGVALPVALANLASRVPSADMRQFVVAVLIQRDTGGNLTELLGNLSRLIRERLQLLMKVRVLSAEGRMSAWVLCALPFVLAAVINVINPQFMAVLWTDPMGLQLIYSALAAMAIGVLWMRKIIRIRV